jgi:hypothetical protein
MFRHAYLSGLDESGAQTKVQEELMRTCFDPDDDECLWTSDVVIEAGSEWEGGRDGAQAA